MCQTLFTNNSHQPTSFNQRQKLLAKNKHKIHLHKGGDEISDYKPTILFGLFFFWYKKGRVRLIDMELQNWQWHKETFQLQPKVVGAENFLHLGISV